MKIVIYVLAIYLVLLLFLYVTQRQFIYFPDSFVTSPEKAGVPEVEVIDLQTADGLSLLAWYCPPTHDLPTIIYFHGNAGNISHRAPIIKPFLDAGYGILLLTYRGYSGNPGSPSEQGLYYDARAAVQFLQRKGVPNHDMILYGNSIGAAVAVQMATEYPVGAVILLSPFTSLGNLGQYHYPLFPVKWLIWDRFDSIKKVQKIEAPTLIIYGENDRINPPKFSRKLFEAIPKQKQLIGVPDSGHNDLFDPNLVIQFIRENLR